jgi:sugar transferase (PEP-CTERM/EpsH1 system associated)
VVKPNFNRKAERRLKVLVLDEEPAYPPDSGKKTRSFNLLTRLSKEHDIEYLCYVDPAEQESRVEKLSQYFKAVYPVLRRKTNHSGLKFYAKLLLNIFSSLPFIVSEYYSPAYRKRLACLLKNEAYDLIHCEISPYIIFVKNCLEIPRIGVAHNVEAEIWRRYCATETNPLRKAYTWLQYRKVREYEAKYLKRVSTCVAVSERDARYIREKYGLDCVCVVPNGVDTDYFFYEPCKIRNNNLVFSGSMDWRPNQDAVKFFLYEIWPLIRTEICDATFTIVGRNPPEWMHKLADKQVGVELTGTVTDVRPFIRRGHVFVVPLRIGGGSRLKILEAMSLGKAVVSTSVGAEGLDVEDKKNILIEDSPRSFVNSVVGLLKNDDERAKLQLNGRKLVENSYGWEILATKMGRVWMESVC